MQIRNLLLLSLTINFRDFCHNFSCQLGKSFISCPFMVSIQGISSLLENDTAASPDIHRVIGTITRRENASAPWQPDTTVCRSHAVTSLGSVLSTARKMPRLSASLTLAEDRGRFCRISDHFSEVRVFPFPMPLSVSFEVIVNIPIF